MENWKAVTRELTFPFSRRDRNLFAFWSCSHHNNTEGSSSHGCAVMCPDGHFYDALVVRSGPHCICFVEHKVLLARGSNQGRSIITGTSHCVCDIKDHGRVPRVNISVVVCNVNVWVEFPGSVPRNLHLVVARSGSLDINRSCKMKTNIMN